MPRSLFSFSRFINSRTFLLPAVIGVLAFSLALFSYASSSWQTPEESPPGDNVTAPINTSTNAQTFAGSKSLSMSEDGSGSLDLAGGLGVDGILRGYGNAIFDGTVSASAPIEEGHVVTKGWVEASVGAGRGLPLYQIRQTSQSTKGNLGGRAGANQACENEFGESAVFFGTQHVNCYTQGTCILDYRVSGGSSYWFDQTSNRPQGSNPDLVVPAGWNIGSGSGANCTGWISSDFSQSGPTLTYSGSFSTIACNIERSILCAIPK
ncbi:MAG: hypothetical protein Q8P39_01530 [Candidatus Yanofskybacteria bacterium]|nr:hypothetical protein [Candidatus Yanofskybacteria bacterium]